MNVHCVYFYLLTSFISIYIFLHILIKCGHKFDCSILGPSVYFLDSDFFVDLLKVFMELNTQTKVVVSVGLEIVGVFSEAN